MTREPATVRTTSGVAGAVAETGAAGEALLVDFGSTMTKVRVVDLADGGRLVASAEAPTTVATSVTKGLRSALGAVGRAEGFDGFRQASSSAAGGLRMIAVGLVPDLTTQAAQRAALGAGAKLVGAYGYELGPGDLTAIAATEPDIILLAGGIDGGNREVVLGNARLLAGAGLDCVVVMAGNRSVADLVRATFATSTADCVVTENVMPEIGLLNIEPCREVIRQLFESRIVKARGIGEAEALIDVVSMPTPLAVLRGAELLAGGTATRPGLGDLVVVDIGGATTDVHSICDGLPTRSGVVLQGLPEPMLKRTVEGDLGIRISAQNVLGHLLRDPGFDAADWARCEQVTLGYTRSLAMGLSVETDREVDIALASCATDLAMSRHAGTLERVRSLQGWLDIQRGKDLTAAGVVIGTGGFFREAAGARQVLSRAVGSESSPVSLRPREPLLYIDRSYCLASAGLLRDHNPEAAFALARRSLVAV